MLRYFFLAAFGISLIGALMPTTVAAQVVAVDHTGDDSVGMQLAYRVREEIGKSSRLTLGSASNYGWKIVLVTVGDSKKTSYSMSLVLKDNSGGFDDFVTSIVGICGADRVESCARSIVAGIDVPMQQYRDVWERLIRLPEANGEAPQ